jgi:pyrroloquinoline quinone biosynthesis protein A
MVRALGEGRPGLRPCVTGCETPRGAPPGAAHGPTERRPQMTWQTPQAVDFRFGFEITMYAAAR